MGGKKKTKGKQKIEMRKVACEEDRMITFSKRRSGLYKKMNELVTSCEAEAAFLVFSGAGTAFSFAHPSMESVADRLLKIPNHRCPPKDKARALSEAHRRQRIEELTSECERLEEELEVEREREEALEEKKKKMKMNGECWWRTEIDEIAEEDDRRKMHDAFLELHDGLCEILSQRLQLNSDEGSSHEIGSNGTS